MLSALDFHLKRVIRRLGWELRKPGNGLTEREARMLLELGDTSREIYLYDEPSTIFFRSRSDKPLLGRMDETGRMFATGT